MQLMLELLEVKMWSRNNETGAFVEKKQMPLFSLEKYGDESVNSKNKIKILIGDLKKIGIALPALIVFNDIFYGAPILLTIYYSFTNLALSVWVY